MQKKLDLEIFRYIRPYLHTVHEKCGSINNYVQIQNCIQNTPEIKQYWQVIINNRDQNLYNEKFVIATLLFYQEIIQYDINTFENFSDELEKNSNEYIKKIEDVRKRIQPILDKINNPYGPAGAATPEEVKEKNDLISDLDTEIKDDRKRNYMITIFNTIRNDVRPTPSWIAAAITYNRLYLNLPTDLNSITSTFDIFIQRLKDDLISLKTQIDANYKPLRHPDTSTILENLINNKYNTTDTKLFNIFFNIVDIDTNNEVQISSISDPTSSKYRINMKKFINETGYFHTTTGGAKKRNHIGGGVNDVPIIFLYFPKLSLLMNTSTTFININKVLMDLYQYKDNMSRIINTYFTMSMTDFNARYKKDENMLLMPVQEMLDKINNSKFNFTPRESHNVNDDFEELRAEAELWKKEGDKYYKINNDGSINRDDVKIPNAEYCTQLGLSPDDVCEKFIRAVGDGKFDDAKQIMDNDGFKIKPELKNLNPSSVINVLNIFQVEMREFYDERSNTMLMKFESYESWLSRRPDDERNKLEQKDKHLKNILKAFIFFINANPKILNPSHNGISDEQPSSLTPPNFYIERSINKFERAQSTNKKLDWNTLSKNLPGLNTMSPGISFEHGSPFGNEYFPQIVLPQVQTYGQLRGFTSGLHGGNYDTSNLYTDLKSKTKPAYGSNIEELLKKLKEILMKYNKKISNAYLNKIETNIDKFKNLEKDLYDRITKISEYGKLLELNGDNKGDYNVTVSKMENYIRDYKHVERKFTTTHDFLREIYNLLASKLPSNESASETYNKVDIDITH